MVVPLPSPLLETDYSLVVKDSKGKNLRVFLNKEGQWCFPPDQNKTIPDKLKKALITYEDACFYWHPGINPVSVLRAAYQNITQGKIVSGASTITMQLARAVNNSPRTFYNKIIEMFLALKLEYNFTKDDILKAYLTHAPFGGNIQGYQAAAERYFEKSPDNLSWAEAATLAVLPNAPGLVSPSNNTNALKEKRDKLLKKLFEENIISESTFNLAILEPVISHVYPFEIKAPHLTQIISNNKKDKKVVETTLDYEMQSYIEMLADNHARKLHQEGIKNCAAIVAETKSGKIKAYIGSQNYFDRENFGMVNGVIAPRSSGSILKPFLYALSIDEGIILPQTLMTDIPSYFKEFAPSNADQKFNGLVSAKEALIRSLNIPAVRLLNTYGVYSYYSFLKKAGVSTLFRSADDYGLTLIVGGAEVNVLEMAMLYRGLANGGKFSLPYFLKADSISNVEISSPLISPAAASLTLDMLREVKRPGVEYYWQQFEGQNPIAWKTGTSYGGKDAWAVGVTPEWTIAVWVGNFDGEGNANLSGAGSAGPLLFSIFNYLPKSPDKKWFEKIEMNFRSATICKETGFLAGPNCDYKEVVDVPIGMRPLRLCPYHKKVFMDKDEKYTVCSLCWEDDHIEKNILVFPADVVHQLRKRGQIIESSPDHNPECKQAHTISQIKFIYPLDSTKVILPRDFDGKQQKLVARAAHLKPSKQVFWYLDQTYLGTTNNNHEQAINLSSGWHKLYVVDEDGSEDDVKFYILSK